MFYSSRVPPTAFVEKEPELPCRISLVQQTADVLRRHVRAGRWGQCLPGEHHLSDLLQIGRSTLRQALAILERERLVRGGRGRRRVPVQSRTAVGRSTVPVVAVISPVPLHHRPAHSTFVLHELRRHLQRAGFELQLHVLRQTARRVASERLQTLLDETRAACWVLASCTEQMQQWFAARKEPVMVFGSCHPKVDLPFVKIDAAAACRHAVGRLRSAGHKGLALLLPQTRYAGAKEVEAAFVRACVSAASRNSSFSGG